ncbi:patatin-like phospholipase family protein [Stylonychia lemnae]|uniref:Patatin-like phospholipase family protein n=1 Tax=Stylonychia lemnae TaxID=5949 RepID=A0A078AFC5_STYLE|nr:patatin-like phospholipase family protein [Stylonychia lemnae]|eukprot:CDW79623.1 patatin-like phospholipase family protein [Stylonychia lemnae]
MNAKNEKKPEYHDKPAKLDKCYGLVLSDGIDLGPYQAGVLSHYTKAMLEINQTYNFISGVGVGGINAFLFAQQNDSNKNLSLDEIKNFWKHAAEKNHYSERSTGFLYSLFFEDSLYESTGISQILSKFIQNKPFNKGFSIGITNILDGHFRVFNENQTFSDLLKVLHASITYPGVSELVDEFDALWLSGSTVYEADLNSAILRCEKLGYKEERIVIDVVLSIDPIIPHQMAKLNNGFQNLGRAIQLQSKYEMLYGVIRSKQSHPKMEFRYISGPSEDVASKNHPFDYNGREIDYLYDLGIKDAKKSIENRDLILESLSPIFFSEFDPTKTTQKREKNLHQESGFLQDDIKLIE